MPTIIDSLTSLVSSIFQTIGAVFQSVFAVIQSLFNAVLGTFHAIFAALWGAISGVAHTFGGLTKFLFGNIVVIAVGLVAFVAYSAYQQRTRTSSGVAPAKQKKVS